MQYVYINVYMHIIIKLYFVHSSHFYKILDLTSLSLAIILGKMSEKKELFEFKEKSFNNPRRRKIMYTISSEKYLLDIHDIVKLREKKRAGKNCLNLRKKVLIIQEGEREKLCIRSL